MHFIGMLAFVMPMPVNYDLGLTLLSLVVAIEVTGFGFFMIGTRRVTALEFTVSGIFMGIGIVSMHYTGMATMRMPADVRYDPILVTLSILIAIGASIVALWLAFRTTISWQRCCPLSPWEPRSPACIIGEWQQRHLLPTREWTGRAVNLSWCRWTSPWQ
jgi:NO-binding membrane sensor protein with MHYT domain